MVSEQPIFPDECLKTFSSENEFSGAIVSFSGKVRNDKNDGGTEALVLQAYEPITSSEIEQKRLEALKRWPLEDALIRHRIGKMAPGETIVFVATAAKHRRDAFLAADFLMDYLKIRATSEKWIEPKESDYQDAQRWVESQTQES